MDDLLEDLVSELVERGSLCHVRCGCGCGFCFHSKGVSECPLCKAVWARCDCGRVFRTVGITAAPEEVQSGVLLSGVLQPGVLQSRVLQPGVLRCGVCELGISPKPRRALE
jgi:hypothetical protein